MPAIAAIAINNGEASPVSHSFSPLGQDAKTGIWWYEDQSPRVNSTSPLGWPRIGILTRRNQQAGVGESAKNRVNKVEVTLALPYMETLGTNDSGLTPAPTVAYIDRAKVEFFLSERDDIAMRKDVLAFSKNLLSHATITDLVQNLTTLY